MRWARRLSSRFAELEELHAGLTGQRRVTWLGERLALVRSKQGVIAIAVAPAWQIAAFTFGGLSVAAVIAVLVGGAFLGTNQRQAREIVALRDEVRGLADRATQAEHARIASEIEAGRRVATERNERKAMIAQTAVEESRLESERDVAVDRVSSALERVTADRRKLEQERDRVQAERDQVQAERDKAQAERDRAQTERDDLANEVDSALHELDGDTRRTMASVEKIISGFGVDPRLVRQPSLDRADATGGPYIPWVGPVTTADKTSAARFESVAHRLERLKALRDALQQFPIVMPVTHAVLSGGFGFRFDPFNGTSARHEGTDLRASDDPTIHAAGAGTIISAGWNGEFGNMIEIDHGFTVVTRYAHLSRINVHRGDVVLPGQPIGVIGATGRATGVHLHYEIRIAGEARDPLKLLSAARASAVEAEPFAGFEQP
jgi:murein DD-endopeptidase MepM/ murein hydrolase activator NlpD